MKQFIVTGMSCAACQARVEKAVSQVPGVTSCSVSLLTNSMGVEGAASEESIIGAVEKAGYGAVPKGKKDQAAQDSKDFQAEEEALKDRETPAILKRLVLSLGFLLALMYVSMGHGMWGWPLPVFFDHNPVAVALVELLLSAVVMLINRKFFMNGFRGLLHRSPNMDTLVALGSMTSFVWSVLVVFRMTGLQAQGDFDGAKSLVHGLYFESAAMILTLISVGKLLEARSKGKTTNALKELLKLAPKTAVILENGQEKTVSADAVKKDMVFVVRPGESIPVDGEVLLGESAVNEASLTGESLPAEKIKGSLVSQGTLNLSGFLTCRATRVGEDTTLAQIISLVSDAAATKAPIARIADKVSGVFVPAVMGIAFVTFLVWLLLGAPLGTALERGISVLVISCPCALGLATPVAIMVGNGVGARNGILFKTSEALEETGKVRIVALDKTGTLTKGMPEVTDVIPGVGVEEKELLAAACSLEALSEHPLAGAIVRRGEAEKISREKVEDFEILPGNGLKGNIGGRLFYGGSLSFMEAVCPIPADIREKADQIASQGKTPVFFGNQDRCLGLFGEADVLKEDSVQAVREMHELGLKVVMLTGDNQRTAKAIGKLSGVDLVIAGVLPDEKEAAIRSLQTAGKVAMVGDGINDAVALTRADIGIAIGAGTDVALDAADLVLMKSSLLDVPAAIRLSRRTLTNIRENLFWAFFYNVLCIPLAAGVYTGILNFSMSPMIGAAAMSLSSFCVVSNALRLNFMDIRKKMKRARDPVALPRISGNGRSQETKERCAPRLDPKEGQASDAFRGSPEKSEEGVKGQCGSEDPEGRAVDEIYHTQGGNEMEKILNVNGMMCGHCEMHVKKALEAIDGVQEATADHTTGKVKVSLTKDVPNEVLAAAIKDAGYDYVG